VSPFTIKVHGGVDTTSVESVTRRSQLPGKLVEEAVTCSRATDRKHQSKVYSLADRVRRVQLCVQRNSR
jgi:hypothetical protein